MKNDVDYIEVPAFGRVWWLIQAHWFVPSIAITYSAHHFVKGLSFAWAVSILLCALAGSVAHWLAGRAMREYTKLVLDYVEKRDE